MKVILQEHVAHLGKMGDVVDVKDGYARNYLLPRGLAILATTRNMARLEHELAVIRKKAEREQERARKLAGDVEGLTLTIHKAVGETGRLYGSVTAHEIEDHLHEAGYRTIDRKQIVLEHPIKEIGEFEVPVRIHPDVTATLKVRVVPRRDDDI